MSNALPQSAIEADAKLEGAAVKASEGLAKHRWHWTLDESNPKRVPIREYARAVGRTDKTIRGYAHGYTMWTGAAGASLTLNECIERARMGAEQEAVTEAVAEARGVSFGEARKRGPEVRRVREMARDRAEHHNTTIEEEAPKVADWIVKAERSEQKRTHDRKQRLGLRFVEMEGELAAAKRRLTNALNLAHQVPWGDEERELLRDSVANIQALLALIDTALGGVADVDWDSELAKLAEVEQ